MDEDFKQTLETELRHLQSYADEFARDERYARLAEKIGLSPGAKLQDPFVDWLLHGYAFLAARVKSKLDDEFPRFTQNLLSVVHPHLSAPTPSMIVAEFRMKPAPALMSGPTIRRGRRLVLPTRPPGRRRQRERLVYFTTGRDVRLWPIEVSAATYLPDRAALSEAGGTREAPAGLALDLALTVDNSFDNLETDELDFFLTHDSADGARLFEALALSQPKVDVLPLGRRRGPRAAPVSIEVRPLGLDRSMRDSLMNRQEDFLLPYDNRSFDGYRLLHEYFALPARFHFIRLSGLRAAFAHLKDKHCRVLFHFPRPYDRLSGQVRNTDIRPNCVPAVNLFEKQADDLPVSRRRVESLIVPDKGDPTGYEIHSVTSVVGRHDRTGEEQVFRPFFATTGFGARREGANRFYNLHREARAEPALRDERDQGLDEYRGTEVSISLIDEGMRPISDGLRTLSIGLLCTNRHLPIYAREAKGEALALRADTDEGWESIRIAAGPSMPRTGLPEGRRLWDAVSHLSLNYLSLVETEGDQAVSALRQIMRLYAPPRDLAAQKAIDALRRVAAAPVVRRAPFRTASGPTPPVAFVRGAEISLFFDKEHDGASTLAAIMERFLAGYSSANSFSATVMRDLDGLERLRWSPRSGSRAVL